MCFEETDEKMRALAKAAKDIKVAAQAVGTSVDCEFWDNTEKRIAELRSKIDQLEVLLRNIDPKDYDEYDL